MKPADRIKHIAETAAGPVRILTTNPLTIEPESYTVAADEFGRLLKLTAEARWAAAFIERLRAEADEAARYAKEQRDDTYPVHPDQVNWEAGEEPGEPHPWSQGFHEGAAHVVAMLGQWFGTDPESFGPPDPDDPDDSAFRIPEDGPITLQVDDRHGWSRREGAVVLEFDREPQEPGPIMGG